MKKNFWVAVACYSLLSCSIDEFKNKDITIKIINSSTEDVEYSIEVLKYNIPSTESLSIFGPERVGFAKDTTLVLEGDKTKKGSNEGFYRLHIMENNQAIVSKDFGYFDGIMSGDTKYKLNITKDSIVIE